jgi:hypothetical protein
MARRRKTMLLERPDATGGIAVLADGTRVYWATELGPKLVARSVDGTCEVIPTGGSHPVHDAYVELCDRGASVVRPLKPAEGEELQQVIGEFGSPAQEPAAGEAPDADAEPPATEAEAAKDIVYRVFPLSGDLREAVRAARDRSGVTNRSFVAGAVTEYLPGLVQQLADLGFGTEGGPPRPIRLPFSREAGTLDALRAASDQTSIPASQLLGLCLAAAARTPEPKKGRRGRKKAAGE